MSDKSIIISHRGVEVGAEVTPRDPSEASTASVRYYVERVTPNPVGPDKRERIYISREDAMAINAIDLNAWIKCLDKTVEVGLAHLQRD